jgi:hypothetical protein
LGQTERGDGVGADGFEQAVRVDGAELLVFTDRAGIGEEKIKRRASERGLERIGAARVGGVVREELDAAGMGGGQGVQIASVAEGAGRCVNLSTAFGKGAGVAEANAAIGAGVVDGLLVVRFPRISSFLGFGRSRRRDGAARLRSQQRSIVSAPNRLKRRT